MMPDAIQQAFVSKQLDDALQNVFVTLGDRQIAALGGRLNVKANGAPRLELYFSGDPLMQGAGLKPGTIIPESHYAAVSAETHSGYKLHADRIFYDTITGHDFTRFEFDTSEVE